MIIIFRKFIHFWNYGLPLHKCKSKHTQKSAKSLILDNRKTLEVMVFEAACNHLHIDTLEVYIQEMFWNFCHRTFEKTFCCRKNFHSTTFQSTFLWGKMCETLAEEHFGILSCGGQIFNVAANAMSFTWQESLDFPFYFSLLTPSFSGQWKPRYFEVWAVYQWQFNNKDIS